MNINKLVEMARSKNPNPQLAKLSLQWAEQNKMGNPVRNAVSLWWWRWFMGIDIGSFLIWLTITLVWHPRISTIGHGPSIWAWVAVALVGAQFVSIMSMWENYTHDAYRDAKRFIQAISVLEKVIVKPIDKWTLADCLEKKARTYLNETASLVKSTESIEKEEIRREPWRTPSLDKQAGPMRDVFESHFDLLTTALPLPKDRGVYYGNKAAEVPATN